MNVVYFVQRADGDIKIGTCTRKRLPMRLVELEVKYGELIFYGYVEGGIEKEQELHDRFSDYQRVVFTRRYSIPCKTEFFESSVAILGYIERHCISPSPEMRHIQKEFEINPNKVVDLLTGQFGGRHQINRSEVSRQTGLSCELISKWIRGRANRARIHTIKAWCDYLDVHPSDILVNEVDSAKL